ncbi:MAG: right-handed parallel beta-helix repeat-containing protein, partial [Balneolaceae bacterium]
MRKFIVSIGVITVLGLVASGCDSITDSSVTDQRVSSDHPVLAEGFGQGQGNANGQGVEATTDGQCEDAGDTGLTAVYVNQSLQGGSIDFADHTCDMAIYFDENAPGNAFVRNVTVIQETGAGGLIMGIWNNGGEVTVSKSTFRTDVAGQYIPIRFENGATGTISDNSLTGTHRSGMVIRGEDTNVRIRGNSIAGSGAKSSGWAENGIQVDQGATASILNNTVEGHWWDGESNWASTGIMLFGSDHSAVTNNKLTDNEFSVIVFGDDNTVKGNRTNSKIISESSFEFRAWGILVAGSNNDLSGNGLTATEGAAGIYIYSSSEGNKLTGNRIRGFEWPIVDGGEDTMARGNPSPAM